MWYTKQIKLTTITIWPRSAWVCFPNKQCVHLISQEISLEHIKRTIETVTGCFLRGHQLPALCEGEGGEGGLQDAAVWVECVPEKTLLCVLHCLISLWAKQHHTLFSTPSLRLSAVSVTPDTDEMSICAPDFPVFECVGALAGLCAWWKSNYSISSSAWAECASWLCIPTYWPDNFSFRGWAKTLSWYAVNHCRGELSAAAHAYWK